MKLATFRRGGSVALGLVDGDAIFDLRGADVALPTDMGQLLAIGPERLARLEGMVGEASERLPLDEVKLEPPVRPGVFLAVALNYADHVGETGAERPEFPLIFNKQVSCVAGPGQPILLPPESGQVDYEGELAIVIGQRCRRVSVQEAQQVIGGYTIANDVSVRDWQRRGRTMTMGKSWDTHGPLGPYIITADELPDPHDLELRTWVNSELRQAATTAQMLFNCYELVAYISTVMTLCPGDVIATGTPSGVGAAMVPPRYLVHGDVVRVTIDGIGDLVNPVVDEEGVLGSPGPP